jgi:hypothetical protein
MYWEIEKIFINGLKVVIFMNNIYGFNLKNRYFALRHGESEANVLGIILSSPIEGPPRWRVI